MIAKYLIATALIAVSAVGCSPDHVSAVSKDGRNEIRLFGGENAGYEILRDGEVLVPRSGLSMSFADGRTISPAAKAIKVEKYDDGVRVAFEGDWALRLAARDDGVAYRFETSFGGKVKVVGEKADVTLADANAKAYVNYAPKLQSSWESVTKVQTFGQIETADNTFVYLPVVFQRADGTTLCITESDLHDYAGWLMQRKAASPEAPLTATFATWPTETINVNWKKGAKAVDRPLRYKHVTKRADYIVETAGTRTYPWRVFMIAEQPIKLCEAKIVDDLAEQTSDDFSWVRPGKVAWDWWNAFDNKGDEGCTTEGYIRFIDFAAKNGIEYVIFDEGWSKELDIWTYSPKVDVPKLIDYANGKGVGIILWMAVGQVYGKEACVTDFFGKLGAKGFKVDFMDRDDADMIAFEEKFAAECAKRKLLVDYHGMSKPTGLHRKYPNIVNYEGVHGLECMKWFNQKDDFMLNDLMQFYVRMSAGPMDYTPGAMDNYPMGGYKGNNVNPGSLGTRCRQIAMMSLYLAPLQMLSDSPTKYERNMESFKYMAAVPTVWDETVGIDGSPTEFAVAARRHGGEWWCAGMASAKGKAYTLDTSFLCGGKWSAEIFRDAEDSATRPTAYVREIRKVSAGDKIRVDMAPGGGFSIRFSPVK